MCDPAACTWGVISICVCGCRKPSGSGLVGKLSNKLSSKNTGFQRFDDGVEMQNGKGGFGSHA